MGRYRKGSGVLGAATQHKRGIAFALTFAMALELVPAQGIGNALGLRNVALAEEQAITAAAEEAAVLDGTSYGTVDLAITAANRLKGGTHRLEINASRAEITVMLSVKNNTTLTLDLSGAHLTTTKSNAIQVEAGSTLNIVDDTASTSNLTTTSESADSSLIVNYGTLNISDGIFTGGAEATGDGVVINNKDTGELTITGGTFVAGLNTAKSIVYNNGGKVTVNEGTFTAADGANATRALSTRAGNVSLGTETNNPDIAITAPTAVYAENGSTNKKAATVAIAEIEMAQNTSATSALLEAKGTATITLQDDEANAEVVSAGKLANITGGAVLNVTDAGTLNSASTNAAITVEASTLNVAGGDLRANAATLISASKKSTVVITGGELSGSAAADAVIMADTGSVTIGGDKTELKGASTLVQLKGGATLTADNGAFEVLGDGADPLFATTSDTTTDVADSIVINGGEYTAKSLVELKGIKDTVVINNGTFDVDTLLTKASGNDGKTRQMTVKAGTFDVDKNLVSGETGTVSAGATKALELSGGRYDAGSAVTSATVGIEAYAAPSFHMVRVAEDATDYDARHPYTLSSTNVVAGVTIDGVTTYHTLQRAIDLAAEANPMVEVTLVADSPVGATIPAGKAIEIDGTGNIAGNIVLEGGDTPTTLKIGNTVVVKGDMVTANTANADAPVYVLENTGVIEGTVKNNHGKMTINKISANSATDSDGVSLAGRFDNIPQLDKNNEGVSIEIYAGLFKGTQVPEELAAPGHLPERSPNSISGYKFSVTPEAYVLTLNNKKGAMVGGITENDSASSYNTNTLTLADGMTIKLQKDISVWLYVRQTSQIDGEITFDLNGHSIDSTTADVNYGILFESVAKTVHVVDSASSDKSIVTAKRYPLAVKDDTTIDVQAGIYKAVDTNMLSSLYVYNGNHVSLKVPAESTAVFEYGFRANVAESNSDTSSGTLVNGGIVGGFYSASAAGKDASNIVTGYGALLTGDYRMFAVSNADVEARSTVINDTYKTVAKATAVILDANDNESDAYSTLQAAIDSNTTAATIKLLSDVKLTDTNTAALHEGQSISLDLDGHSITGNAIVVDEDATLTITNGDTSATPQAKTVDAVTLADGATLTTGDSSKDAAANPLVVGTVTSNGDATINNYATINNTKAASGTLTIGPVVKAANVATAKLGQFKNMPTADNGAELAIESGLFTGLVDPNDTAENCYAFATGDKPYTYKVYENANVVARIGDVYYDNLNTAFGAVKAGDEVILVSKITVDKAYGNNGKGGTVSQFEIPENAKAFTLNGDGNTIVVENSSAAQGSQDSLKAVLGIKSTNAVTIKNLTIDGGKEITQDGKVAESELGDLAKQIFTNGYASIGIHAEAKANVTLTNVDVRNCGVGVTVNGATVTTDDLDTAGNVVGVQLHHGSNGGNSASNFAMSGGTLAEDISILCDESVGTLASVVDITGGAYKCVAAVGVDAAGKITGGAKNVKLNISKGTFEGVEYTGTDGSANYTIYVHESKTSPANVKVAVSGGDFATPVAVDHCADGFMPTGIQANGYYSVLNGSPVAYIIGADDDDSNKVYYGSLQSALDAAKSGDTVYLDEVAKVETPVIAKTTNVTLDLNGNTLTSAGNTLTVAVGASLTVTNSGLTGVLKTNSTDLGTAAIVNNGDLTLTNVEVESASGQTITNNANLTVVGVTVDGDGVVTATDDTKVTIKNTHRSGVVLYSGENGVATVYAGTLEATKSGKIIGGEDGRFVAELVYPTDRGEVPSSGGWYGSDFTASNYIPEKVELDLPAGRDLKKDDDGYYKLVKSLAAYTFATNVTYRGSAWTANELFGEDVAALSITDALTGKPATLEDGGFSWDTVELKSGNWNYKVGSGTATSVAGPPLNAGTWTIEVDGKGANSRVEVGELTVTVAQYDLESTEASVDYLGEVTSLFDTLVPGSSPTATTPLRAIYSPTATSIVPKFAVGTAAINSGTGIASIVDDDFDDPVVTLEAKRSIARGDYGVISGIVVDTTTYANNTQVTRDPQTGNIMPVASVKATGQGNYTGTVTLPFAVFPLQLVAANETDVPVGAQKITVPPSTTFAGDHPALTVKIGTATTLVEGTDYTVDYSSFDSMGGRSWEVTITGIGNYTTGEFDPNDVDFAEAAEVGYELDDDKLTFRFDGPRNATALDNANISMWLADKAPSLEGVVDADSGTGKTDAIVKALDAVGTKVWDGGTAGTHMAAVSDEAVKPVVLLVAKVNDTQSRVMVYDPAATTNPDFRDAGLDVEYGDDAVEVGDKSTVTVTGDGQFYTATPATLDYTVVGGTYGPADVKLSPESAPYTGEAIDVAVTVEIDGTPLSEDNYVVEIAPSEVKEIGTYTITVTAAEGSDYAPRTGKVVKTFEVTAADKSELEAAVKAADELLAAAEGKTATDGGEHTLKGETWYPAEEVAALKGLADPAKALLADAAAKQGDVDSAAEALATATTKAAGQDGKVDAGRLADALAAAKDKQDEIAESGAPVTDDPSDLEPGTTYYDKDAVDDLEAAVKAAEVITDAAATGATDVAKAAGALEDATKAAEAQVVPTPEPEGVEVYRFYNPNSGEHFFTADPDERDGLKDAGWVYEDVAWVAPVTSSRPVYRLYNPNDGGDHHYTMSEEEVAGLVAAGWRNEAVAFYSDEAEGTPVYRVYNPNERARNHHYTTDAGEYRSLVAAGWNDEGVAMHGLAVSE